MNSQSYKAGRTLSMIWLISFILVFGQAVAQTAATYPNYDEDVFMEWDLEKNLATPVVEKSEKKAIAKYMKQLGENLRDRKYHVELMREGEVVIVSLPSDELFMPNDTLLTRRGLALLTPLTELMRAPYMYKVVYTINTDDTGSKTYREKLSDARNASVYDWLMDMIDEGKVSEDIVIIPYSNAATTPVASNEERAGRARNRRVEFFFVPGPEMIEKAKLKKLKY